MRHWAFLDKISRIKQGLRSIAIALLLTLLCWGGSVHRGSDIAWAAGRESRLPVGNAITDSQALLRNALPLDNPSVRELQVSLEDISNQLKAVKRWGAIGQDLSKASRILSSRQADLLASVVDAQKPAAESLIQQMLQDVNDMQPLVETQDKNAIREKRADVLQKLSQLEESMIPAFPYAVPSEYSHLPQLKGRATVQFKTTKGDLTVVVDGYSAPVTAGNFVDLVQRHFYDGLEFTRAEESYVLQIGDPVGPEDGFIDPKTKKYRNIPLEILVKGDTKPTYGITLEDAGRFREQPVLPFSSYGTVAMARPGDDPDGGSSQFFFFLFEPELTPAGLNLLDGRYAVFGFVVDGQDVLSELKAGDKIVSAQVTQGANNLVASQA
jgi:peptidylprolyl isomerase